MRTRSPGWSTKPGSMMPSSDFLLEPRRPTVMPQPRVLNGCLPSFSRMTHSLLSASGLSAGLISTKRIAIAGAVHTGSMAIAIGSDPSIIKAAMGKEVIRVVAAVIEHEGRYLITQRQANAVLPLLWEFPGGRVEPGEDETKALAREVRGRIGVDVIVGAKLGEHLHEYTNYQVQLTMYSCKLPAEARPYPATVADLRWVTSREFLDYDFPPADEKTMSKLLGLVRN